MELVFSLSILAIISLLAGGITNLVMKSFSFSSAHGIMTRDIQNTLRLLGNEIAMATPDDIKNANDSKFRFSTLQGEEVQIQYQSNQGILRCKIGKGQGWRTILSNIDQNGFRFSYFKADGSEASGTDQIKRVKFSGELSLGDQNAGFSDEIFLRNP